MRLIKWVFWLFVALCIAGTAFAISNPENVMAAPFRGIAAKTLEASSSVMGFFRSARTVAATEEHSIISNALYFLMLDRNIRRVPEVDTPCNDMTQFPSAELPLYPDYISTRYTQFSYTVNSQGELLIGQSDVSVDPALGQIYVTLDRLRNVDRVRTIGIK